MLELTCQSDCYWWQWWWWYWDCCFRWKDWEGNVSSSFQSRFDMMNQVLGSSPMYMLQLDPWPYRSPLHMFLICSRRRTYNLGIIQLHFTRVYTKIASDMLILLLCRVSSELISAEMGRMLVVVGVLGKVQKKTWQMEEIWSVHMKSCKDW